MTYRFLQLAAAGPARLVWRIRVEHAHRLPDGPVVVAANHESLLDPIVLGGAFRRQLRFVAKEELWSNRLVAALLDGAGGIPIRRGRGDLEAMSAAVGALRSGAAVAIFPEGTCLPYRERPWLRGAARLALATGAPLLPVCLLHTERALRPHRVRLGLPRIRVLVGEPIPVEAGTATIAQAKALTERVRLAVEELRRPYGPPEHVWIPGRPGDPR